MMDIWARCEKAEDDLEKAMKIIEAYERFEGEVEYALSKVQNDRVEMALDELTETLKNIG
jgi:hypothetical protein